MEEYSKEHIIRPLCGENERMELHCSHVVEMTTRLVYGVAVGSLYGRHENVLQTRLHVVALCI
jgi:hypothetical protein